ncbi:NAD(+)/NADH kinase [Anaerococcus prevotii]|uniref:NAD kinase n=1 Tax=Anaerococcus prevotii ACS-065-V-Col13 TaxID=879305 RepID=F0GU54_9FIRM|nr:NAD(+)/NADH kinase [Anaerococcus prevotii]EGC82446.1 NAD(+)/NADH kinase [Anaerococcus prevotii ACS-065-V-Col13]MDU5149348.1 NAD(+)/NADH kinase [Anaerococcus prevotii]
MTNKINVFKNKSKFSKSVFQKSKKIMQKYGYTFTSSYEDDAVLNLVIGGDGTFLNAVHLSNFSDIPFIGINTGHLGFYQEVEVNMIENFIRSFDNKDYRIENLSILEARINNKIINSINEVVVKSDRNQIIRLKVFIDGNFIEAYSGDGLIISTPHGSTAYNLSAGGAILHQSLNGFQLTPIAPVYSNMNKSLRCPVVLPNDATIDINISKRDNYHTVFIFDGKEYSSKDYKIRIGVSDRKIKKLILNKNHYWTNIKNKLM